MKKILTLMILTGNIVMANSTCFDQDFQKIRKDVSEAKKLKNDKTSMAKIKYSKHVVAITKSVSHIKEKHFKDMNNEQKKEINNISSTFTN